MSNEVIDFSDSEQLMRFLNRKVDETSIGLVATFVERSQGKESLLAFLRQVDDVVLFSDEDEFLSQRGYFQSYKVLALTKLAQFDLTQEELTFLFQSTFVADEEVTALEHKLVQQALLFERPTENLLKALMYSTRQGHSISIRHEIWNKFKLMGYVLEQENFILVNLLLDDLHVDIQEIRQHSSEEAYRSLI